MIDLKNIKKSYFVGERELPILKGIDLAITPGEFVVLMGVSGSGKTTLMNIVGLLDKQTEGDYTFAKTDTSLLDDESLADMRNRYIGFVFQQFFLLPYLDAIENVLIPIVYSKKNIRHPREKAKALLAKFGLEHRVHNKPGQLSGGEQQRVAIARALVNDPELILADEPTGALDSKTSGEIMDLFKMLNDEGKTIIVVTHDPKLANFGKRLVRIEDGAISEDITA